MLKLQRYFGNSITIYDNVTLFKSSFKINEPMRLNSLVQNLKEQKKTLLVVVPIGNISIKTQIGFTMCSLLFIDSCVTLLCSLNPCEQRNLGSVIFLKKTPPTFINSCEVQNLCNVSNNLPNLCKRLTFVLRAHNSCSLWYPFKLISIPIHVVNVDVQTMVPPQAPLLVICQLFHKCT